MKLEERVSIWRNAFDGDDNSISQTLSNYAWNHAVFTTAVLCVRGAPIDEDGQRMINMTILDLLWNSYWGGSVLAIRRLVDKSPLIGKHGVCSIAALIMDAKSVRHQLTRSWFLSVADLPFDVEAARAAAFARPSGAHWVPRSEQYHEAEQRHALFDFLSGTLPAQRSANDLVRPEVFDQLASKISHLEPIADHATIHFAHSAPSSARTGREVDRWGTEESTAALKALCQTAELFGRWFLNTGIGEVMPTPQDDQFRYLEMPLATPEQLPVIEKAWETFTNESRAWHRIMDKDL